jgi:outer membrane protein assembly factor BamA
VRAILFVITIAGTDPTAQIPAAPAQAEIVADVRVHGNAAIPADEILRLAALEPGTAFTATTLSEIERRLRESGRFRNVEILKRFASISDASQIVVVIIVDEGPVRIEWAPQRGEAPRTVRRRGPPVMFLPVLDAEDGYGLTYGARFAVPEIAGANSRLAFPLTWGGDKRAGIQLERGFEAGPVDRLIGGAAISRRKHPFFQQNQDRVRIWARVERELTPKFRAGATLASEAHSFLDRDTRLWQTGAEVVFDTRVDPFLARNAVYARVAWDRFAIGETAALHQRTVDVRGHLGLLGQSLLVGRAYRSEANRRVPAFLQPVLGGMDTLRGFKAGSEVGDTLTAGSVELRVPLTSPLNVGKVGVSAFVDLATAYDHGERLRQQRFEKGLGGGVWLAAAFLRVNLAVARGVGRGTRVHVGSTLSF